MKTRLSETPGFRRDVKKISAEVHKRLEKSLNQFLLDRNHPGLHFEVIKKSRNLYSIRVGRNHRVIMKEEAPDSYILLRVAVHDVYQRL